MPEKIDEGSRIAEPSFIKEVLVRIVNDKQGTKATLLVVELMQELHLQNLSIDEDVDVPNLIQELVSEGELLEIEYILPNIPYRVKSFLLPKGSSFSSSMSTQPLEPDDWQM